MTGDDQQQRINNIVLGTDNKPGIDTRVTVLENAQRRFWGTVGWIAGIIGTAVAMVIGSLFVDYLQS